MGLPTRRKEATTQTAIERNEMVKQVLELRNAGMTLKDISTQLGIGLNTVTKHIRRWLAQHPAEAAEEFREQENEKYDRIEKRLMQKVDRKYIKTNAGQVVMVPVKDEQGNPVIQQNPVTGRLEPVMTNLEDEGPQNEAIGLLLKLWHRRAMLNGIDVQQKALPPPAPTDPTTGLTMEQFAFALRQWKREMNGNATDLTPRPASASLELTSDPILKE